MFVPDLYSTCKSLLHAARHHANQHEHDTTRLDDTQTNGRHERGTRPPPCHTSHLGHLRRGSGRTVPAARLV